MCCNQYTRAYVETFIKLRGVVNMRIMLQFPHSVHTRHNSLDSVPRYILRLVDGQFGTTYLKLTVLNTVEYLYTNESTKQIGKQVIQTITDVILNVNSIIFILHNKSIHYICISVILYLFTDDNAYILLHLLQSNLLSRKQRQIKIVTLLT